MGWPVGGCGPCHEDDRRWHGILYIQTEATFEDGCHLRRWHRNGCREKEAIFGKGGHLRASAWFGCLQGRPVIALTETTAAIQTATGNVTVYRKHNKPGYGPVGDSLDDLA